MSSTRTLLIIIAMSLILPCVDVGKAHAYVDLHSSVSKVTMDEQASAIFPNTYYPYVTRPNHCGANDWTRIIPEHPFCFRKDGKCLDDFSSSCDRHDMCYMKVGIDRRLCDKAFLQNMLTQCQSGGGHSKQHRCRIMAHIYYGAVRIKGKFYFRRIQQKQEMYEAWLQNKQDQALRRQNNLVESRPSEFIETDTIDTGELGE